MAQKKDGGKKEILNDAVDIGNRMSVKNISSYAASIAFFFFVSVIPLLMLLSALLPLTGLSEEELVSILTSYTPVMTDPVVSYVISEAYGEVSGLLSFSFLIILYASARGMLALARGINTIYDINEPQNYFKLLGKSVLYTVALIIVIILSLVLMVFGKTIMDWLLSYMPEHFSVPPAFYNVRYLFVLAIAVLLFMAIYAYLPAKRQPFLKQLPGALFSALGWGLFSFFFSLFVGSDSIYNTYYGSLAAIVILLMWLYGCFYILLLGAYVNHDLPRFKKIVLKLRG